MVEYQKIGTITLSTNWDYLTKTYMLDGRSNTSCSLIANEIISQHPSRRIWVNTIDNVNRCIEVQFSVNNYHHLEESGNLYWNILGDFDKITYKTPLDRKSVLNELDKYMEEMKDLCENIFQQFKPDRFQEPVKIFFIRKDTLLDDAFVS